MNAILHDSFLSFADAHGFDTTHELVIDCFAGGGGASEGMEMAMRDMRLAGQLPEDHRCAVDIAINHDPKAIAMHAANHPRTMHLTADIWTADPLTVTGGIAVGALWASPDCRGFSKAKGGAPVSKSVRSLAWVVAHWADQVRPREIYMENVEEFQDWCDLDPTSRPDKNLKGKEFKRWVARFRRLGYRVEWRVLRANFFGAPTIRKRLYIMMRCDGEPIFWPAETHADPKSEAVANGSKQAWPVAADILDFDRPCPSILMTKEEAKAYTKATGIKIIRPLAFNSEERIAKGTKRYVIDKGDDAFVVLCNHSGTGFRGQGIGESFDTVTRARDAHGLVVPHLMTMRNAAKPFTGADEPTHTITAGGAGLSEVEATIAPFLSHGQQGGRSRPATEPAHTIAASTKDTNQVAAVYIAQHNGGSRAPIGRAADEPLSTLTVEGSQQQAVSVYLGRQFGKSVGHDATESNGTVTAGGGGKSQVVSAHMISMKGSDRRASSVEVPATAATAQGQHTGVVMPFLQAYYGVDQDTPVTDSVHTVTTKDRFSHVEAEAGALPLTDAQLDSARKVAAFLRKYDCWDDREFVTLTIRGVQYIIIDIGMRMLTPRELARAQGFRETYILAAPYNGGFLTETDQRHKIGNSVCPDMAYALFRQNYRPKPRLVVNNDQGWLFASSAPSERAAA
ncbi:DNA cytosine methyltransferase [Devosia lacusdianchii]|uniref:DNA cytosine methyltransferase n=1 Tax=Devosia lacusdianchii TaxID=2917991 RepID=UPI001F062B74|nr:DNA cytosine methyltransferase [Devosia sp. JXJ CY 41]